MGRKKKIFTNKNSTFIDTEILNNETFMDYLHRLKKIAVSLFEWENLPDSMSERFLEECLFYNGQAALLKDEELGFINTAAAASGNLNIYELASSYNCYSLGFSSIRKLYTGLDSEEAQKDSCILVLNNQERERMSTYSTLELFAYRLYNADRISDININAQKTPVAILGDENSEFSLKNAYEKYDGNEPVILFNKDNLTGKEISSLNTEAPYVADKLQVYKKQIWNEALTYLGIDNIQEEKKERLVTEEASSNNELINLNLQSYLIPRKLACKQFNKLFNMNIDVKPRSDIMNVIKTEQSAVVSKDFEEKEGEVDEQVYN